MVTEVSRDRHLQGGPSSAWGKRSRRLGKVLLILGVLVALAVGVLAAAYEINRSNLAPALPHYPNVERACYPSRLEAQLLGEAFCGIETRDSYRAVVEYYNSTLPQHGWNGRWYKNPAGYCYTLLIIENSPAYAGTPPGVTSVAFKLRQAFPFELNTITPPGCK